MMDRALVSAWVDFPPHDESPANCSGDPHRMSCWIKEDELAKRDLVAMVRIIVSLLSLLGSLSIIISVLVKRQVCSPKIHPIFMLSIADCFLSLTWIGGGALWLSGGAEHVDSERAFCFIITLSTVILECVVVNLTLLYALLAYYNIKQKDFSNVYLLFSRRGRDMHVWRVWKTLTAYAIAWILPAVLILVPFFSLSSKFHVLKHTNICSCWCLPYYGNVVPMAFAAPGDISTSRYLYRIKTLVASYSIVIGVNYLVGFICLTVIYWQILRRIRELRRTQVAGQKHSTQALYGTMRTRMVSRGEKKAKARVVSFLTIFVGVGFINTLMAFSFFISEVLDLTKLNSTHQVPYQPELTYLELGLYLMQSSTLPLQGFLNAMVYGWTREDFLQVISGRNIQDLPPDEDGRESLENSQSILVSSGGEVDTHDFGVPGEHREVSRSQQGSRHGFLDTVEEVTEPDESEDNSFSYFDGKPRSI